MVRHWTNNVFSGTKERKRITSKPGSHLPSDLAQGECTESPKILKKELGMVEHPFHLSS